MLFYHNSVASLYRYIATYKVAQGKYDETLDCLENMCNYTLKLAKIRPNDKYKSPFMDQTVISELIKGIHIPAAHNATWYILKKIEQDRYDPIREVARFKAIEERFKAIAQ